MADGQHGGYRAPANPAAASGPGALSQRTDGGPATQGAMVAPGGPYGSRQDQMQIQQSAPMQGGGNPAPPQPQVTRDMLTPLDAPSQRPNEPITAGLGSVPTPNPNGLDDQTRERLQAALPVLAFLASQPQASEATRQFYRSLRGDL